MGIKVCTGCAAEIAPLEEFPGCRCIECHAALESRKTPEELVREFPHFVKFWKGL